MAAININVIEESVPQDWVCWSYINVNYEQE
jgi:hypothetical protein